MNVYVFSLNQFPLYGEVLNSSREILPS